MTEYGAVITDPARLAAAIIKAIASQTKVPMDLSRIQDLIRGKKTYLVLLTTIIGIAIAWAEGQVSNTTALESLIASLLGITGRSALKDTADRMGESLAKHLAGDTNNDGELSDAELMAMVAERGLFEKGVKPMTKPDDVWGGK